MSHLQLPAEKNGFVIEEVSASLVDDSLEISRIPSLPVTAASPLAEAIALEKSVDDYYRVAVPRRSQSNVTIQSLVKTKEAKLLDYEAEQLMDMGFPRGLALEMGTTRSLFPIRFWIVDNSGSMLSLSNSKIPNHHLQYFIFSYSQ